MRAAESLPSPGSLRLARAAFEFFRPSRMRPSTTDAVFVRQGRRLTVIDTSLRQGGRVTARAQLLYAATGPEAEGDLWQATERYPVPPGDAPADREGRLYRSGEGAWTADAGVFGDPLRKQIWQRPFRIVSDEEPSPYQLAAAASDLTNLVVHAGSRGIEHINADVCMTLARVPDGAGLGLAATQRMSADGISVGAAVMFDAHGPLGVTLVTGLSNIERAVTLADEQVSRRDRG